MNPLFHKVQYLSKLGMDTFCQTLLWQLRESSDLSFELSHLPYSQVTVLATDLIYLQLRHQRWLRDEHFLEIASNYIASEHLLRVDLARAIIDQSTGLFSSQHSNPHEHGQDDDRFLQVLIALTLNASDIEELILDCGIGPQIFKRIVDLTEKASRESAHHHNFLSSFDAQIIDALTALSLKLATDPDHSLKIILKEKILDATLCSPTHMDSVALDVRLAIIKHLTLKRQARFQSIFDELRPQKSLNYGDFERAMDDLQKSGFIFRVQGGRNPQQDQWSAAETGERIASPSLARELIEQQKVSWDSIIEQTAWVQSALLRAMPGISGSELLKFLTQNVTALAPPGVIACIQRLAKKTDASQIVALIEWCMRNGPNPWTKAALCRELARQLPEPQAQSMLKQLAEKDTSATVREAAFSGLVFHSMRAKIHPSSDTNS